MFPDWENYKRLRPFLTYSRKILIFQHIDYCLGHVWART